MKKRTMFSLLMLHFLFFAIGAGAQEPATLPVYERYKAEKAKREQILELVFRKAVEDRDSC